MKNVFLIATMVYTVAIIGQFTHAKEVNVDVLLKNLYAERDFDNSSKPTIGSWTQGITMRGNAKYALNDQSSLTFTGSMQYATRLNDDKNVNDMIIPFDPVNKTQAKEYNKVAGSIGFKHENHHLSWGEQWVNTPLATTDYTRQLTTIYHGLHYSGKWLDNLTVDLGYLDKYSPRNEEKFRKISVAKQPSDSLKYVDLKYDILDKKLKTQLFISELEDLYNQYSIGLKYETQYKDLRLNTKVRYYYTIENGAELLGEIDNKYYGIFQQVGYGANTVGIGVQKIDGKNDFPMLDGGVPVLDYINWTGLYNKANELGYHYTFNHDASWIIPNLNLLVRYVDGQNYKINGKSGYDESGLDLILDYKVTEGRLKGLAFKLINIHYKNDIQGDYTENRFFTTYSKKF